MSKLISIGIDSLLSGKCHKNMLYNLNHGYVPQNLEEVADSIVLRDFFGPQIWDGNNLKRPFRFTIGRRVAQLTGIKINPYFLNTSLRAGLIVEENRESLLDIAQRMQDSNDISNFSYVPDIGVKLSLPFQYDLKENYCNMAILYVGGKPKLRFASEQDKMNYNFHMSVE